MHEIYMHPFLRSVQADVASGESATAHPRPRRVLPSHACNNLLTPICLDLIVMCSYNLINNTW